MKSGRGFTLVEMLAAITIMGILLAMGILSLRNMQIDTRDQERQVDVESIGRALETYYVNNNGSYPINTAMNTIADATTILPGTNADNFRAPGVNSGTSIRSAQNTSSSSNVLSPSMATTDYSLYVYQPFAPNGSLCTSGICTKYKIIYRREIDSQLVIYEGKY